MQTGEIFRTWEGRYRILVEQMIDGESVDWHLIERREINVPDRIAAHHEAVTRFVGRAVNWTGESTVTGYVFTVAK